MFNRISIVTAYAATLSGIAGTLVGMYFVMTVTESASMYIAIVQIAIGMASAFAGTRMGYLAGRHIESAQHRRDTTPPF